MSEVKMIDVYGNLPWREDGNVSFLYVEPIQNIMIAKAVNNYDRLQQENAELRKQLKDSHEWLGINSGYKGSPLCVNNEALLNKND